MPQLVARYRETKVRAAAARYRYAAFLADHPDQVFFNDWLWRHYQRYTLTGGPFDAADLSSEAGRAAMLEAERRLRDAQEERWRAYLMLDELVREAGRSELGRRAARKALSCLDRINTERFGREEEIEAARARLAGWLQAADGRDR